MNQFKSETIKHCLLFEKSQYQIIKNEYPTTVKWWRAFGYPAQLNDNKKFQRIEGFISCYKCKNTQIYNKLSGTKRYKEHADKCFPILNITATISPSPTTPSTSTTTSSPSSTTSSSSISFTSSSSTSAQVTLNQMGFTKSIKFNEKDIRRMKDLSVEWVCGDIRPFSIFDDVGFRRLAQECVRL
ncbi:unnamed protein product, partial [Rotaria sp. Silwood2]